MAERTTLNQTIQIGKETTEGTAVAATKQMAAMSIEPSPNTEVDTFRPAGQKFSAFTTLGKEWVQANVSGKATYTELVYPLASICPMQDNNSGTPTNWTSATPIDSDAGSAGDFGESGWSSGDGTAKGWNFYSQPTGNDTWVTYTVEHGDSVRADEFAGAVFTELGLSFSRSGVDLSGAIMGRALDDGITMTPSLSQVDLVPILPTQTSVYLHDSADFTSGTPTLLTRVVSVDWNLGSRFGPVWPLNAALGNAYAATIETEPDLSMNLTMEADGQGMAFLESYLRTSTRAWLRIECATATEIETGIEYRLTIDTAVEVQDTGGFSDSEGLQTIDWSFTGVNDTTWGGEAGGGTNSARAFNIALINDIAAL